jgi:hypothetical protein
MSLGLMLFFGIIRIGLVDRVVDNVAHIEYVSNNGIEYIDLSIKTSDDCKIKEGIKVYFDDYNVIACFR